MDFNTFAKKYSKWKLQETGSGKLTRGELSNLRECYKKKNRKESNIPRKNSSEPSKLSLRESSAFQIRDKFDEGVIDFDSAFNLLTRKFDMDDSRAVDFLNGNDATIGYSDLTMDLLDESTSKYTKKGAKVNIKEKNINTLSGVIKKYRNILALQEKIEPREVKISYKELKYIKEQVDEANIRGVRLIEADMGMDPTMGAQQPGMDPNAMGAAGPTTPVDPSIVAQVQDAKNSIDALAQAVGVQSVDPNADPNAGMPAVDGMQQPMAGDPNAGMGGQPMMESKKTEPKDELDEIRERIAARKSLHENGAQEGAKKDLQRIGISGGVLSSGQENKGSEGNAEQVVVPSASSLANGYTSGKASSETKPSKTWPTKATKSSDTGGALQGSGASQKKVKESEEAKEDEKEDKLEENVQTVTDKYIDQYMAPKLSFDKLKEALSNSMLG